MRNSTDKGAVGSEISPSKRNDNRPVTSWNVNAASYIPLQETGSGSDTRRRGGLRNQMKRQGNAPWPNNDFRQECSDPSTKSTGGSQWKGGDNAGWRMSLTGRKPSGRFYHQYSDPKVEAVTEPSERRLEQRQKQIDYGKNTVGYQRYSEMLPKIKRKRSDPSTPDKHSKCSKRCWDGMIRHWRRKLHEWDPPDPNAEDSGSGSKVSDLSDEEDQFEDLPSKVEDLPMQSEDGENDTTGNRPWDSLNSASSFGGVSLNLDLQEKLRIWDEKFQRCFGAGRENAESEPKSFFSTPFSAFGMRPSSNSEGHTHESSNSNWSQNGLNPLAKTFDFSSEQASLVGHPFGAFPIPAIYEGGHS